MDNSEFIEVLSPGAEKRLQAANAEILKMISGVKEVNANMIGIKTPSGSDSAIKKLTADYDAQQLKIAKLQIELEKYTQAQNRTVISNNNVIKSNIAVEASIERKAKAQQKAQAQSDKEEAKAQILANVYNKTQRQLNLITQAYNDLSARKLRYNDLNENEEKRLITLASASKKYQLALGGIDIAIDKYGRKVGNYASGNTQLSNSIAQISREIPNFGQSVQIGIMSITNNIGALQDAVRGIIAQNAILKAEGQATRSVMSQIGASILSFNTLLYVGVAVLSAYGKEIGEWVSSLFEGDKALAELTERQKKFNEARLSGRKDAQAEILELRKYLAVINDRKLSDEQRKIAQDALLKQYPYYIRSVKDAMEVDGQYSKGVKDLIVALEKRKEVEKKSELNVLNRQKLIDLNEELDVQRKLEKAAKDSLDRGVKNEISGQALASLSDNYNKILQKRISIENRIAYISKQSIKNDSDIIQLKKETIGLEYQLEKIRKEREKKSKTETSDFDRQISDLERQKKLFKDLLDDEKTYVKEKIKLSEEISANDISIAKLTLWKNLKLHKDNLELQAIDLNEYLTAVEKAESESQERIIKIKKDNFDAFLEYRKKYGRPADAETFGEDITFLPTDKLDEMISGYEKLNNQRAKSKKLTEEEKKALDDFFKSFQESFFGEVGMPTLFKYLNGELDKFMETWQGTFEVMTQIAQEAFNVISEASNANFANEYRNLEQQKEVALLFAGESATAREEIERQAEARRRSIAKREFQAKKQQALFNIAIDTAQAIIATLARTPLPAGLPLVIATGALGLAQATIVASQQAPQFWKGTDNAPEGFAWTQEKGREVILDKSGKLKSTGSDKGAQLTYLNKGDKVLNNDKTKDYLMFNSDLNNILTGNDIGRPVVQVNNPQVDFTPVINAINNKESVSMNIDRGGLNVFVGNGHTRKQMMNNRFNGIGQIV